jgi:hypothetical protein
LQVIGKNLNAFSDILLCPKPEASKGTAQVSTVQDLDTAKSSATVVQVLVRANPGSAGDYAIYLVDKDKKTYETGKMFKIASSDDTKYVACAAPANRGKPDANLACSFVPLSYETELQVFGKGIANRFIAVEVIVRNKNPDLEYLLQDIRIGMPDFVLSSYDKKIPRAVSEKAEQFSARAIIVRITAAGASILTGIAGFAGNEILTEAAEITAGPFQTGLQSAIPNLSTAELARLDDLGFSTTSTVIPKNSSVAVVGFVPSDTLEPMPRKTKQIAGPFKWLRASPNSFSTYQGDKLKSLFSSLLVQVAGIHVQEVNPSQPTLKLLIPPGSNTISLSEFRKGTALTIQGSGLNSVAQVELTSASDGKTVISSKLQPLKGESSVDPNVAQLSIPADSTYAAGTYEIKFIPADGSAIDTKQAITVAADTGANPSQPTLTSFNPAGSNTISLTNFQKGTTITIDGSGLNSVTKVQLTNALGGKMAISTKLEPLKGQASIDPNEAQISIPAGKAYTKGKYEINFVLGDGSSVDTKQAITVTP